MQRKHRSSSIRKNYDILQRKEQKKGLVSTRGWEHPEQEGLVCKEKQWCLYICIVTRKAFLNQITIFLFIFDPLYMIKTYISRICHLREPPTEKPTKTEIGIPDNILMI